MSETVALSCTFVPNATDEFNAITASVALLCNSVTVDDGALLTRHVVSFASLQAPALANVFGRSPV